MRRYKTFNILKKSAGLSALTIFLLLGTLNTQAQDTITWATFQNTSSSSGGQVVTSGEGWAISASKCNTASSASMEFIYNPNFAYKFIEVGYSSENQQFDDKTISFGILQKESIFFVIFGGQTVDKISVDKLAQYADANGNTQILLNFIQDPVKPSFAVSVLDNSGQMITLYQYGMDPSSIPSYFYLKIFENSPTGSTIGPFISLGGFDAVIPAGGSGAVADMTTMSIENLITWQNSKVVSTNNDGTLFFKDKSWLVSASKCSVKSSPSSVMTYGFNIANPPKDFLIGFSADPEKLDMRSISYGLYFIPRDGKMYIRIIKNAENEHSMNMEKLASRDKILPVVTSEGISNSSQVQEISFDDLAGYADQFGNVNISLNFVTGVQTGNQVDKSDESKTLDAEYFDKSGGLRNCYFSFEALDATGNFQTLNKYRIHPKSIGVEYYLKIFSRKAQQVGPFISRSGFDDLTLYAGNVNLNQMLKWTNIRNTIIGTDGNLNFPNPDSWASSNSRYNTSVSSSAMIIYKFDIEKIIQASGLFMGFSTDLQPSLSSFAYTVWFNGDAVIFGINGKWVSKIPKDIIIEYYKKYGDGVKLALNVSTDIQKPYFSFDIVEPDGNLRVLNRVKIDPNSISPYYYVKAYSKGDGGSGKIGSFSSAGGLEVFITDNGPSNILWKYAENSSFLSDGTLVLDTGKIDPHLMEFMRKMGERVGPGAISASRYNSNVSTQASMTYNYNVNTGVGLPQDLYLGFSADNTVFDPSTLIYGVFFSSSDNSIYLMNKGKMVGQISNDYLAEYSDDQGNVQISLSINTDSKGSCMAISSGDFNGNYTPIDMYNIKTEELSKFYYVKVLSNINQPFGPLLSLGGFEILPLDFSYNYSLQNDSPTCTINILPNKNGVYAAGIDPASLSSGLSISKLSPGFYTCYLKDLATNELVSQNIYVGYAVTWWNGTDNSEHWIHSAGILPTILSDKDPGVSSNVINQPLSLKDAVVIFTTHLNFEPVLYGINSIDANGNVDNIYYWFTYMNQLIIRTPSGGIECKSGYHEGDQLILTRSSDGILFTQVTNGVSTDLYFEPKDDYNEAMNIGILWKSEFNSKPILPDVKTSYPNQCRLTGYSPIINHVNDNSLGSCQLQLKGVSKTAKFYWSDLQAPIIDSTMGDSLTQSLYYVLNKSNVFQSSNMRTGLSPGSYTVVMKDQYCSTISAKLNISKETNWLYAPGLTVSNDFRDGSNVYFYSNHGLITRKDDKSVWGPGLFVANTGILSNTNWGELQISEASDDNGQQYAGFSSIDTPSLSKLADPGDIASTFSSTMKYLFYFNNNQYYIFDQDGMSKPMGSSSGHSYRIAKTDNNMITFFVDDIPVKYDALDNNAQLLAGGCILTNGTYFKTRFVTY